MVDVVLAKLESIGTEASSRGLNPPFGILYLADVLEKSGFSVRLVHEEGTRANIQALGDLVSTEKPAFLGFSVMTGPSIIPSLEASAAIKERCDIPIVWGGLQPTTLPKHALAKTCIDVLGIGEGEATIVELAQALCQSKPTASELETVPGIAFKADGQVILTEPRPFIKNLDEFGAAWHLLDIERYIRPEIYLSSELGGERVIAVNTSRGCPWRCAFCYNQAVNKRSFRAQSAARVMQDIRELKDRHRISGIRFSEDHFFSDPRRALKIIQDAGIPWTATIRVDDLDRGGDDFVKDLAENHCAILRVGVEAGSQQVLNLIQKDIRLDQARRAVHLCGEHGVRIAIFFILGFPGESWADVCETLDLIDELQETNEYVIIPLPHIFCPFPGTPLLDVAIQHGFKPPATLEGWGKEPDDIVKNTGHLPPYVDQRVERAIAYMRLARVRSFDNPVLALPAKIFQEIARLRWKHRFFSFPLDWYVADLGRKSLKKVGRM
jgi:anaerobic magnesium-protoporphyrin IX monomethyl ester cyclase